MASFPLPLSSTQFTSLYPSFNRPSSTSLSCRSNLPCLKSRSVRFGMSGVSSSSLLAQSRSFNAPIDFHLNFSKRLGLISLLKRHRPVEFHVVTAAAAADADGVGIEASESLSKPSKSFADKYPALVTGFFFFLWYFLNVIFNILNKKVYNYFPYPYFVSVVHLLVGVVYCLISWAVGLPKRAVSLMHKRYLVLATLLEV